MYLLLMRFQYKIMFDAKRIYISLSLGLLATTGLFQIVQYIFLKRRSFFFAHHYRKVLPTAEDERSSLIIKTMLIYLFYLLFVIYRSIHWLFSEQCSLYSSL